MDNDKTKNRIENTRHINIPVFIPHLGCPNDCVFCNQKKISGKLDFDIDGVDGEIKKYTESIRKLRQNGETIDAQIAFFGGSFTGIDECDMIRLLEIAKKYIDSGFVSSIRLSTRPDYISPHILDILVRYGVKNIELGIQSMKQEVLDNSKRGHKVSDIENSMKLIKEYGFSLTAQMMIGLPHSSLEDEIYTAKSVIALGADSARIYPTVVLKGTELAFMTEQKKYTPLDKNEAIYRTSQVLYEFVKANVPVIRIGLCAQDNLSCGDDGDLYTDCYNEAVGECAISAVYLMLIENKLLEISENKEYFSGKNLKVYSALGTTSKIVGHKGINKANILRNYGFKSIKVIEKSDIIGYNIIIILE